LGLANIIDIWYLPHHQSGECSSERGHSPLSIISLLSKQLIKAYASVPFGEGARG
jgi:hypothetical protein